MSSAASRPSGSFNAQPVFEYQLNLDNLLAHYKKLDEEIRTELPLKLIWSPAGSEEED
jgi:hypothetical protein